ncbi:MAG: hypothetical protein U5P10_02470 [Spirochaetia bacterium]|nr:hypothetical protein [Spirochaetia bacterium]
MIGVSPAYFLSRFSPNFTPAEVEQSLEGIRKTGFLTLQLETFLSEQVEIWDKAACSRIKTAVQRANLEISQFVAHHLMHYFSSIRDPSFR